MYMPPPTKDFQDPPEGTHPARCYRVIDLGTQEVNWEGSVKHQRKVMLSWELQCDERMEDGRPFTVSKRYTLSSSDKGTLRKDLESWRGKKFEDADFGPGGFDISKLVGVPCLLGLARSTTNGKTYTNVAAIMKILKGVEVKACENEQMYLSLEVGSYDPEVFNKLSDNLKETIRKSPEFDKVCPPARGATAAAAPAERDEMDQDIPF